MPKNCSKKSLTDLLLHIITMIRNTARGITLALAGLPISLNPQIIRMELLAWALGSKAKRYQIGNYFFHKKGLLDTHPYGETPHITLARIAKRAGITPQSKVLDMGSGAGRTCAWFAIKKKCCVTGVEMNPQFVSLAKRLAAGCNITQKVTFIEHDMLTLPPQDVDIIYIYHSALDDNTIMKMGKQLALYDTHVKIITVSYAFDEILPEHFETEQQFDGWFPWGITWVYIQRPTGKPIK